MRGSRSWLRNPVEQTRFTETADGRRAIGTPVPDASGHCENALLDAISRKPLATGKSCNHLPGLSGHPHFVIGHSLNPDTCT